MLLLLVTSVLGFECDPVDNDPLFFNIHPLCNYRGQCIDDPNNAGEHVCECCRPFEAGNYCFGDEDEWYYGDWSGAQGCKSYTHYLYSIVQYLFHMTSFTIDDTSWAGREEFKCPKQVVPANNNGVYYAGDAGDPSPQPDLIPFLQVMLGQASQNSDLDAEGYGDYDGDIVYYYPENSPETGLFAGKEHCRICLGTTSFYDDPDNAGTDYCLIIDNGVQQAWGVDWPEAGRHLMLSYATNYNTWYDEGCAKNPATLMPQNEGDAITGPSCDENGDDRGQHAEHAWRSAIVGEDQGATHTQQFLVQARKPTDEVIGQDYAGNDVYGLGWDENIGLEKLYISYKEHSAEVTTPNPPPSPTTSPSPSPTHTPTDPPEKDCFALGYTHTPDMLEFKGISEANGKGCRQGFESHWTGSGPSDDPNMCDSPYVVCLPAENTPNVGFPVVDENDVLTDPEMYKSDTHRYTLDECKRECAYDQRCNGFEMYNPDPDGGSLSQTGICMLIDDLEVEMGTSANAGVVDESTLLSIPDWRPSSLNGGRICYEKNVPCNPYFQEDELNDVMLKCYCPNNRKGFYTKNVVRTVAATKYCPEGDSGGPVTMRIREAQANRMFHLCENWCLFNTQAPRTESWYHDPWEECWREQYAGVGTHRSYCYRVIRDPMTIEQHFIDRRAEKMCDFNFDVQPNTPSPTWAGVVDPSAVLWTLADEYDSCDDACEAFALRCAPDMLEFMHEITLANAPDVVKAPFATAGATCGDVFLPGREGWALPGVTTTGDCIVRNSNTRDTGCNVSIGMGYQRLCACTAEGTR